MLMQAGVVNELSFISQLHPLTVMGYFIELFTLLLLFNHLILVIGILISLIGVCSCYFDSQKVRRLLVSSLSFMGIIFAFNLVLNQTGRRLIWQWHFMNWEFNLTESGVIYGLTMALSLGAMIIAFVWFNGVMTIPKISYILFPVVPRLAMLLTISLRLVDLFVQKMERLVMLQKNRNIIISEGSFRQRLKSTGQLLRIVLIDGVSDSMGTAVLMEARGFGVRKRSQYQRFCFQIADGIFLGVATGLFGLLLLARLQGWGWTSDVVMVQWQHVHDWSLVGLLIIFIGLPLIGEGGYRLWAN